MQKSTRRGVCVMKKCNVCGYPVDGDLHEESLPIPEGESGFCLIHASCARER